MGFATSQQLTRYFDLYKNIDVTFTKEVIKTTALITSQVFVKALGGQWPCVINSTSLVGAKVISGVKSGLFEKIQQGTINVSLRFSFMNLEKNEPFSFFVAAKILGTNNYAGSSDLMLVSLQYTQRPPDDLIERIGKLLEANINSTKRREERILMTPDSMRKLGIAQKETIIFISGVPRRCILRDLSFSGSKVIMVGIAQFIKDKDIVLRIDFEDPRTAIGVKGKIVRTEDVEGRKDLVALAICFNEQEVPMAYKMHINNYISQIKKVNSAEDEEKSESQANQQQKSPEQGTGEQQAAPQGTAPQQAANQAVADDVKNVSAPEVS